MRSGVGDSDSSSRTIGCAARLNVRRIRSRRKNSSRASRADSSVLRTGASSSSPGCDAFRAGTWWKMAPSIESCATSNIPAPVCGLYSYSVPQATNRRRRPPPVWDRARRPGVDDPRSTDEPGEETFVAISGWYGGAVTSTWLAANQTTACARRLAARPVPRWERRRVPTFPLTCARGAINAQGTQDRRPLATGVPSGPAHGLVCFVVASDRDACEARIQAPLRDFNAPRVMCPRTSSPSAYPALPVAQTDGTIRSALPSTTGAVESAVPLQPLPTHGRLGNPLGNPPGGSGRIRHHGQDDAPHLTSDNVTRQHQTGRSTAPTDQKVLMRRESRGPVARGCSRAPIRPLDRGTGRRPTQAASRCSRRTLPRSMPLAKRTR